MVRTPQNVTIRFVDTNFQVSAKFNCSCNASNKKFQFKLKNLLERTRAACDGARGSRDRRIGGLGAEVDDGGLGAESAELRRRRVFARACGRGRGLRVVVREVREVPCMRGCRS